MGRGNLTCEGRAGFVFIFVEIKHDTTRNCVEANIARNNV